MQSSDQERELLQLVSEGFIFVDAESRVQEISSAAPDREGRHRSELIGRSIWDVAPELRDSQIGPLLAEAMRDRVPVVSEHCRSLADGRRSRIEVRVHPAPGGLAIFYRDVTRQKLSEEALEHAQAELMHAARLSAMGTMAATMAHELAQPLTSAGTAIDASLKKLRELPSEQALEPRRALELAGTAVHRASEILKRLRLFVAKGQVQAERQDLSKIIADAGALAFPQARRAAVEIRYRLDPGAKWVEADAVQIQQVLVSLIKNATEALADAPERRITISSAAVSPREIEVAVEDSGPGLSEESAASLFAPFRTTKEGGLGLGLSISRTIIQAHGGTVEAGRSAEGGALFRFTLPRARNPAARSGRST